jgi:NADPH-dependent glutamate synthase beta subunit-like oxidoreductase/NAD-dependent dihydropyrimidine dehydrogenase PreA subunit
MPLPYRESSGVPYKISVGTMPVQLNKTGDWRFLTPVRREKAAPCTAACPMHSSIAEWVEKVSDGDWAGAWEAASRSNPFPAVTGHVCYRFCQENCNREQLDEAIAIGDLEKEIGAWRYKQFSLRHSTVRKIKQKSPVKVAVVGSGPAGLASAYYLSLLGCEVVVLEREAVPGGMLAQCIPEYRLPRLVLEQELAMLRALGVVFQCGVEVGRHITLDRLRQEYQAVFAATGAAAVKKLGIEGENLPGVQNAIDYLTSVHLGREIPAAGSVIVIGGGNAAIDAACVARLRGAHVALAYRRTREAMPAHEDEIRAAEAAGVQFLFQVQPEAVLGRGRVERIKMVRTENSKRGEGINIVPGSSFTLECDLLLTAAGQEPDFSFAGNELELKAGSMTNLPGVFAGGDLCSGATNVAAAISAGREGARLIASYLELETHAGERQVFAPPFNANLPVITYQSLNPFLIGRQVRAGLPEAEAGRCLSCGRCNRCGVCWMFCPDLAVSTSEDLDFLLDYCKGCGICAKECPGGVLEMEVADSDTENNHR